MRRRRYSEEPSDAKAHRDTFDDTYTRVADFYDFAVKALPVWKTWLERALPFISGHRVLEVSFGTGYLMTQYAGSFDVYGVEFNSRMLSVTSKNLQRCGLFANLQRGSVENLPYRDECFDSIVNTMAFSAYPDGKEALSEIGRVLKPSGRLVLIDINYPRNNNWLGTKMTHGWRAAGDIIRDMDRLLADHGFKYEDIEIGGFGSVHMYICHKE